MLLSAQMMKTIVFSETLLDPASSPPTESYYLPLYIYTASKALQTVKEVLRPGIRGRRVAAIADKVLDENGIVDRWFTTMVVSGPRTATPHAKTSTRRISPEDLVVVDLGPMWMGYDDYIAYTFIAGRNEETPKREYKDHRDANIVVSIDELIRKTKR